MIALGSDHAGFSLKEEIKKHLDETGVEYVDVGCYSPERFDYAISAQKACDKVVSGECTAAILYSCLLLQRLFQRKIYKAS